MSIWIVSDNEISPYLSSMILQSLTLETRLQQNQNLFHPVVPFNPLSDKLLLMNLTATNAELSDDIISNGQMFSRYIDNKLATHQTLYGIGGYNEHRTIYAYSDVFNSTSTSNEHRRLHIGIDIWGKAGTPVYAPLGGVVHSYAYNGAHGDYGATIILLHQLNGNVFHTLYGHLSISNLSNLEEGKYISLGESIGNFGEPHENGNWPPHLHFQVIKDMEGKWGDYPGVCAYSEREKYLDNCPDPDYILNMMKYV